MKIENEISKAESKYFGNLVCLGNDAGKPYFWAKKITTDLLSQEERELIIALDLYCYDRNFNCTYSTDDIEEINKEIKRTYDIFMDDSKNMDDLFIREYNLEKDQWEYLVELEELENKESMYESIQVVRVEILKNHYAIVFSLNEWEEWALIKRVNTNQWTLYPRREEPCPDMAV